MEVNFSLGDIHNVAKKLLAETPTASVYAFHGEMGAGKTTLVHAICDVLGVTDAVGSPTFSIINQYLTGNGDNLYHMDLYRLKDEAEALNAGVEDCLFSGNTCLVEWPEKAPGIFPADTLHVYLESTGPDTRKLRI